MTVSPHRVGRDLTVEERRTALLRVAVECMASSGYDNLRLRDVARAAGVSIGLLQHYFQTRDELVDEAFRQASEDQLAEWAAAVATESRPWERIEALVVQLGRREDLRAHCLVWVQFASAAGRHAAMRPGFHAIYDKWYQLVRSAVVDGVDAGIFHPVLPTEDVVELLLNQIDGSELTIASGEDSVDGERMVSLTLRLAATLLGHSPAVAQTGRA